jgi:diguanylate cyclase (GGDEF)-like protein/PAS domain S-box-containing protein
MDVIKQRLQLALVAARMVVWDSSMVNTRVIDGIVHWSAAGASLLGLGECRLDQPFRDFLNFVHSDDRMPMLGAIQDGVDKCGGYEIGYRIIRADGQLRWLRAKAHTLCGGGKPLGTLGIIWDDTERKQQEEELSAQKELAETTLASIGDAVITTDPMGKVRSLNRVAEQLTGWRDAEARGKDARVLLRLIDERNGKELDNPVHRCLQWGKPIGVSNHSQLISRDGRRIAVEDSVAPIWSREGRVLGAVAVFRDVSHERQLAREVRWQAAHDALTGLINRREFEGLIGRALASAKEEGHHHALLYLDLDRFKLVNDTCGHAAGDALLQTLSRMLQSHMRESDTLARLGGDELGVLLSHCRLQRALELAEGLRQAVKDFRFVWTDRTFELGVSIGLVEIAPDSKSTTELLVAADQACYLAKESGRNRIHVYQESNALLARRQSEMQWVPRLNEALSLNRFLLFGQPIVSLSQDMGMHQEVLLRIPTDDGRFILPGAFIPAAERYDLMVLLDQWVVKHVFRHMCSNGNTRQEIRSAKTLPELYSINLSGISLNDEGMLDHIVEQFDRYDIDPCAICFEVTETAVIANLSKAQQFIKTLRQLGCRFSLDDFGSGLSSFAYLRALQVDYLKIDGLFIRDIANNPINRAMVKAINEVGHVMGIQTIAEYVEDDVTLNVVRDLGIDYAQGHGVGHPRQLSVLQA